MRKVAISHSSRNPVLDLIRGIAVLLIVAHHVVLPGHMCVQNFTDKLFSYVQKIMVPFNRGGWVAVDLFFVLSGFLVSG